MIRREDEDWSAEGGSRDDERERERMVVTDLTNSEEWETE